jgi:transposase InsO family protein
MKHLVPCRDDTDGKKLGEIIIQEVFKLHGLPDTIVSDRGPQFASEFWKHLCERLGIKRKLSTAFHPQTDGQTERMNVIMEWYLQAFFNYQQDNWISWLPIVEFASNNYTFKTTGYSPFFGNYRFHPRMTLSQHPVQTSNDIREVNANTLSPKIKEIFKQITIEMTRAQSIQAEQADKRY